MTANGREETREFYGWFLVERVQRAQNRESVYAVLRTVVLPEWVHEVLYDVLKDMEFPVPDNSGQAVAILSPAQPDNTAGQTAENDFIPDFNSAEQLAESVPAAGITHEIHHQREHFERGRQKSLPPKAVLDRLQNASSDTDRQAVVMDHIQQHPGLLFWLEPLPLFKLAVENPDMPELWQHISSHATWLLSKIRDRDASVVFDALWSPPGRERPADMEQVLMAAPCLYEDEAIRRAVRRWAQRNPQEAMKRLGDSQVPDRYRDSIQEAAEQGERFHVWRPVLPGDDIQSRETEWIRFAQSHPRPFDGIPLTRLSSLPDAQFKTLLHSEGIGEKFVERARQAPDELANMYLRQADMLPAHTLQALHKLGEQVSSEQLAIIRGKEFAEYLLKTQQSLEIPHNKYRSLLQQLTQLRRALRTGRNLPALPQQAAQAYNQLFANTDEQEAPMIHLLVTLSDSDNRAGMSAEGIIDKFLFWSVPELKNPVLQHLWTQVFFTYFPFFVKTAGLYRVAEMPLWQTLPDFEKIFSDQINTTILSYFHKHAHPFDSLQQVDFFFEGEHRSRLLKLFLNFPPVVFQHVKIEQKLWQFIQGNASVFPEKDLLVFSRDSTRIFAILFESRLASFKEQGLAYNELFNGFDAVHFDRQREVIAKKLHAAVNQSAPEEHRYYLIQLIDAGNLYRIRMNPREILGMPEGAKQEFVAALIQRYQQGLKGEGSENQINKAIDGINMNPDRLAMLSTQELLTLPVGIFNRIQASWVQFFSKHVFYLILKAGTLQIDTEAFQMLMNAEPVLRKQAWESMRTRGALSFYGRRFEEALTQQPDFVATLRKTVTGQSNWHLFLPEGVKNAIKRKI